LIRSKQRKGDGETSPFVILKGGETRQKLVHILFTEIISTILPKGIDKISRFAYNNRQEYNAGGVSI